MTCPHCGKPIKRHGGISSRSKRRLKTAAIVAVILTVILAAVWVFRPMPSKEALVGTWRMTLPVGRVIAWLADGTEDSAASGVLSLMDEDQTATVYCCFFEDDTYQLYADADEVIAAAQSAVQSAVTYACEEGIPALIEKGELSDPTTLLLLSAANLTSDKVATMLDGAIDKVMDPLYDTLREAMIPTQTGNRCYQLRRDCVFTALQKETPVEDSVYLIWQYDGETLRMSAGSLFDDETEELVWTKNEA